MSDVFISYASSDRPRAKLLADNLAAENWSVWWDRTIPPGKTFDEVIESELAAARCVIVIWSSASVESSWVRAEAGEAMNRGVLIPVIMEHADIPLVFKPIQAADLTDWDGEAQHPGYRQLVAAIGAVIAPAAQTGNDSETPQPRDPSRIATLRARVLKAKSEEDLQQVRTSLASLLADEPDNTEAQLLIRHVDGALTELHKRSGSGQRSGQGAGAVPSRPGGSTWRRAGLGAVVLSAVVFGALLGWWMVGPDDNRGAEKPAGVAKQEPPTLPEGDDEKAAQERERRVRALLEEAVQAADAKQFDEAVGRLEEAKSLAGPALLPLVTAAQTRVRERQTAAAAEAEARARERAEEEAARERESSARREAEAQARRRAEQAEARQRELAVQREHRRRTEQVLSLIGQAEEVAAGGQIDAAMALLEEAKSLAVPELTARIAETENHLRMLREAASAPRSFRIAVLPFDTTVSCQLPRERELNAAVMRIIEERDGIELVYSFYRDSEHPVIRENRAKIWNGRKVNVDTVVAITRALEADGAYLAWIDCSDSPNIYDDQYDFHGYLVTAADGNVIRDQGILRNMLKATRNLFAKYASGG